MNSQHYEIMWTNSCLDIESIRFLLNTTVVLSANGGTAARSLQRTRRKGEQRPSSCYVFLLPFRFSRFWREEKKKVQPKPPFDPTRFELLYCCRRCLIRLLKSSTTFVALTEIISIPPTCKKNYQERIQQPQKFWQVLIRMWKNCEDQTFFWHSLEELYQKKKNLFFLSSLKKTRWLKLNRF